MSWGACVYCATLLDAECVSERLGDSTNGRVARKCFDRGRRSSVIGRGKHAREETDVYRCARL